MSKIKQIHAHHLRRCMPTPRQLLHANYTTTTTTTTTTFLFNKLLQSYSQNGPFHLCILLFSQLRKPNRHSFTFAFSACSTFRIPAIGRSLHAHYIKLGFKFDPHVATALLDMYSKCGFIQHARQLFDEIPERDVACWNALVCGYARSGDLASAKGLFDTMPERNVVSWTSMVSGYTQNGMYEEAVEFFMKMLGEEEVRPNAVTIASVLPAVAGIGAMGLGERIEEYARENGLVGNLFVGNALVEMYGKCGSIERARRVFEGMGGRKNSISWNSMIMALAVHGRCEEALDLFCEMKARGFTPDDISFVGVLLACTHGGLVDQGRNFFQSMQNDFLITPKLQHYGCMVDLLGRSGLLCEALDLIKTMPMEPDSVVWGALLGACSFHGEIELAEIAAEFLFKLEPWNVGNHVILSNIYARLGKWESVAEVWKLMKGKQQRKEAGCSVVELDGVMHKFLVEDKSHPRYQDIYLLVKEITLIMKDQIDREIVSLEER